MIENITIFNVVTALTEGDVMPLDEPKKEGEGVQVSCNIQSFYLGC